MFNNGQIHSKKTWVESGTKGITILEKNNILDLENTMQKTFNDSDSWEGNIHDP